MSIDERERETGRQTERERGESDYVCGACTVYSDTHHRLHF